MKRRQLIAVVLAAAFVGVLPAAGCGVEQAREAGERAAGNQQEEQELSGSETGDANSTPEAETDAPGTSGENSESTSRPTQVIESGETGIIFHLPAAWEQISTLGDAGTGSAPIDEVELESPDGDSILFVYVFQLEEVVDESNRQEIEEEIDGLNEDLAAEIGGDLEYAKAFERNSISGREYLVSAEDGYAARMFSVVEADRQYNIGLQTENREDQERHEDVLEEVLGSFEILEPPETTSGEPAGETTAPDTASQTVAEDTTSIGENTSLAEAEAAGGSTSGPTQAVESNKTGVTFDIPAGWELSFPSDGGTDPSVGPLEEFEFTAPDGNSWIGVQVNLLEEAVRDPDSPEVVEQLDQLFEDKAAGYGGEVEYARTFDRGYLSGREYLTSEEDGYNTREYASIKGDRLYVIALEATTREDQERHAPVLGEVLGSFEVLPN